jgi:ribonuclease Z
MSLRTLIAVTALSTSLVYSASAVGQDQPVYFPGTEELAQDEVRVISCGPGMPMPRLKQAAACFLMEFGNGEKLIFDMGTGSLERIYALNIPLDLIDKVFIGHIHMDHMGDLPAFYQYGPQNNRSKALRVWGPGGGGTRPEWSFEASMAAMQDMWAWMNGTLVGPSTPRPSRLRLTSSTGPWSTTRSTKATASW